MTESSLTAFLEENGLAAPGESGDWTPLAGGVSSDIWRVTTSRGTFCVKRALAKLRVAADWEADVGRNAYEWAYMQTVSALRPGSVPLPLAHDPARGLFAMEWLPPGTHPLWKSQLLGGVADPGFAEMVGDLIGSIHAASAVDPSLPDRFATDANFHALRLDAYFLATARVHDDLSDILTGLVRQTAGTKLALVHGDVSPKNILAGPDGPVLLDAEVAWFGDPAFDLAFCLTHLIIKAKVLDGPGHEITTAARLLVERYFRHVNWESPERLSARAAMLLPALVLARIDGKSPVEYLDNGQQGTLRHCARGVLLASPKTIQESIALLLL
ncbi:hypothetical protein L288_02265 [Sphingobium quisquiliarum P25]|uniref:Aminoglycoside phosphotransferase domain-containing protein n=1 Tax=Sphingobium quisquiliarum P25 TaxID=1329909 RepID=T0HLD6_9SPHN|nr:hypothetical protein L288_02265 [Sphingobium quisquiliarum P25]EZP71571.1 Aminoglycoside phosphotransferase [Sphingomonas paucimobilis]